MKYFSMFSGIGGFEYGIEEAFKESGGFERISGRPDIRGRGDCPESIGAICEQQWGQCVGYTEIDRYAKSIYRKHYPEHRNYGDATKLDPESIPDFDLLVGGFPCQAFSIAGKRKGFMDARGTLFFEIARVLEYKRPRYFLLENVQGLLSSDNGKTFESIIGVLSDLGYSVSWQLLNTKDYGLPQNRERIFIAGCLGEGCTPEVFPIAEGNGEDTESVASTAIDGNYWKGVDNHSQRTMIQYGNSQDTKISRDVSQTLNAGHFNQPKVAIADYRGDEGLRIRKSRAESECEYNSPLLVSPTIRAEHHNPADVHFVPDKMVNLHQKRTGEYGDGEKRLSESSFTLDSGSGRDLCIADNTSIRRLTPTECCRLQGFPDDWCDWGIDEDGKEIEISDTQKYRALGNAVSTVVVEKIISKWFGK